MQHDKLRARPRNYARAMGRLLWLGAEMLRTALEFPFRGSRSRRERALWMQRCCRRLLRVFNVRTLASGPAPAAGLLVSNHLSYLDILVLGAAAPAVFVSKSEVRHWPVLGLLASWAGTLFVKRARRGDVSRLNGELALVLDADILVVLFPEGTSSNGRGVLPFKSSLLEPAARRQVEIHAAAIGYTLVDGDAETEVCYWGDMTFVPHLFRLLSKESVTARVSYAPVQARSGRKALACELHREVARRIPLPAV